MYILEYVSKYSGLLVSLKLDNPVSAERIAVAVESTYYVIYQNEN